jgi:hypothetical protein
MGLTQYEIRGAVAFEDWQEFRKSLKGVPTSDKLKRLWDWLEDIGTTSNQDDKDIQVLNYLNALARGGVITPVPQNRGSHLISLFRANKIEVLRER